MKPRVGLFVIGCLSLLTMASSLFFEAEPVVRSSHRSIGPREWLITGTVEFPRRGRIRFFGWSGSYSLIRTAPFELRFIGEVLTSNLVEPRAIEAARNAPGSWKFYPGWFALGLLVCFIGYLYTWKILKMLFQKKIPSPAPAVQETPSSRIIDFRPD
jgi:hypothetical protein